MMSDDISETNRQKPATRQQGTSTDNDNDQMSSTTPTTRCTTGLVTTTSLSTTTFKYTTKELLYSSRTTQGRPTANVCTWLRSYIQFFCAYDLDLEHMTLIHENDLDILKMYWQTKDEPSRSMLSKVTAESNRRTNHDRHTQDRCDRTNLLQPHSRIIIIIIIITGLWQHVAGRLKCFWAGHHSLQVTQCQTSTQTNNWRLNAAVLLVLCVILTNTDWIIIISWPSQRRILRASYSDHTSNVYDHAHRMDSKDNEPITLYKSAARKRNLLQKVIRRKLQRYKDVVDIFV